MCHVGASGGRVRKAQESFGDEPKRDRRKQDGRGGASSYGSLLHDYIYDLYQRMKIDVVMFTL